MKLIFGGRLLFKTTPCAAKGPLFVTMIVYVNGPPCSTNAGAAVIVTARSAPGTVTSDEAEALALGFPGDPTVATLVISPGSVGIVTTETEAVP